jgi:hypothetical protein
VQRQRETRLPVDVDERDATDGMPVRPVSEQSVPA